MKIRLLDNYKTKEIHFKTIGNKINLYLKKTSCFYLFKGFLDTLKFEEEKSLTKSCLTLKLIYNKQIL